MAERVGRKWLWMVAVTALAAANAAASLLQIRPLGATVEALPGKPFVFVLELSNRSLTDTVEVELVLADIVETAADGPSYPPAGTTRFSAAGWLTLPVERVRLDPQAERRLEVTGLAPAAVSGSYHAVILIRPTLPAGTPGPSRSEMTVEYAFAVDVLIGDSGTALLEVEGLAPLAAAELVSPLLPAALRRRYADRVAVRLTLANRGNRVDWLRGYLYLREAGSGKLLQRLAIRPPRGLRVLPESSRALLQVLAEPLASGRYSLELRGSFAGGRRTVWAHQPLTVSDSGAVDATGELARWTELFPLTVQPEAIEVSVAPGLTARRRVVVRNPREIALRCRVEVTGFEMEPDGTVIERPHDPTAAFGLAPAAFELAARSATSVGLDLTLGEGLRPETEHYWLLRVLGRPVGEEVGAERAVGTALVIASDRTAVEPAEVRLEGIQLTPQLGWSELVLRLRNAGGRQTAVAGLMLLGLKPDGGAEYRLPIGENGPLALLAGTTREVRLTLPGVPPEGSWPGELRLNQRSGGTVRLPFDLVAAQAVDETE